MTNIYEIEKRVKRFVYRENYFVNGVMDPAFMIDATICQDATIERVAKIMAKARSRKYDRYGNRQFSPKPR
jgi:hypothetical protein